MTRLRNWISTTTPTQYVKTGHAETAYRELGSGQPLILCTRFRGTLDTWDPAFLDTLAQKFRVITFDYTGIGLSTGVASYDPKALAQGVIALADALRLPTFKLGGWSLGGQVAQIVASVWPDRVTHLLLFGSMPPGENTIGPTPAFSVCALKPFNSLDEEIMLFFEPMSVESREAARSSHERIALRTIGRSPDVPQDVYMRLLKDASHEGVFEDNGGYCEFLEKTEIPILVITGDHDIGFPVENWYNLKRRWRSLFLTVLPRSGNGVHHQYPSVTARLMGCFVECTPSDAH